jgi:hypothetical protein
VIGTRSARLKPTEVCTRAALAVALLIAYPAPTAGQQQQKSQGYVYETKVEEDRNEVLVLTNGAVVEVAGYLGYMGYRKDAVLFFTSGGCRVWLEGKRAFRCDVLRAPDSYARRTPAELVWIERVTGSGEVVILVDGSVFEVLYQSYVTSIWLPGEAILMDDSRLLHLDGTDEIVDVVRIR